MIVRLDVSNVRSRHSAVGHQLAIEGWRRETRAVRGKSARVSRFSSGRGPPDESVRQFKPSCLNLCSSRGDQPASDCDLGRRNGRRHVSRPQRCRRGHRLRRRSISLNGRRHQDALCRPSPLDPSLRNLHRRQRAYLIGRRSRNCECSRRRLCQRSRNSILDRSPKW